MKFVQITIMEAMTLIGRGAKVDGLFYLRYNNADLKCYNKYTVDSKDLHSMKWFLLEEDENEDVH